jgi:hypothetical protein
LSATFETKRAFCENILMTSYLSSLKDEQNRSKLAQAALKKLAVLHTFLQKQNFAKTNEGFPHFLVF